MKNIIHLKGLRSGNIKLEEYNQNIGDYVYMVFSVVGMKLYNGNEEEYTSKGIIVSFEHSDSKNYPAPKVL